MYKIQMEPGWVKKHLINWILFFVVMHVLLYFTVELPILLRLCHSFLHVVVISVTYYLIAIVGAKYLFYNKLYQFAASLIAIFVLYLLLFYLFDPVFLHYFSSSNAPVLPRRFIWISSISVYFIPIIILSYGFYENKANLQLLRVQNEQTQVSVKREIHFLRNQFNHHTSSNFLNHCYGYFLENESAAKMIKTYSDMLHYTLYTKPALPVPLSDEVKYIEQFIQLQKQISQNVQVELHVLGALMDKLILPRILITFVENAFKYGITNSRDKPIKITIDSKENGLDFFVENGKLKDIKLLLSTGIGQLNAKAHLDFFYKHQYELKIQDNADHYICHLHLKI
jgi:two-component system, LytTR family, sensor kinase